MAKSDPAYEMVATLFHRTMPKATITDMYRIVNPPLQVLFEACKARMVKEGRFVGNGKNQRDLGANEIMAFHATTRAAAGGIIRSGFDLSKAGSAFGTALGTGIYVSPFASFSHGYSSEDTSATRSMLLCRVLLGDTAGRDSKSDGSATPSQYVVRREMQCLPSFLLHYRATE